MSSKPFHADNAVVSSQQKRLLELLKERAFEAKDIVLSSGRRSNFYIDCKQVTLHPEGLFLVGQLVHAAIEQIAPQAQAVGGLTLGADPIASAAAMTSFIAGQPRYAFLVRKEPKGHGTGAWIEGERNLTPGMPVVVLEDVVTTGASTLRAIERVRDAGLHVAHVIALVDREEDDGRAAIAAQAPFLALYRKRDFLP